MTHVSLVMNKTTMSYYVLKDCKWILPSSPIVGMGYILAEESEWSVGDSLKENISFAKCLCSYQER